MLLTHRQNMSFVLLQTMDCAGAICLFETEGMADNRFPWFHAWEVGGRAANWYGASLAVPVVEYNSTSGQLLPKGVFTYLRPLAQDNSRKNPMWVAADWDMQCPCSFCGSSSHKCSPKWWCCTLRKGFFCWRDGIADHSILSSFQTNFFRYSV